MKCLGCCFKLNLKFNLLYTFPVGSLRDLGNSAHFPDTDFMGHIVAQVSHKWWDRTTPFLEERFSVVDAPQVCVRCQVQLRFGTGVPRRPN